MSVASAREGTARAEEMADGGLRWLLNVARAAGDGLAWAETNEADDVDPSLYHGTSGTVITLLEAYQHFRDDRFADAAVRGGSSIAAAVGEVDHCSLYFGLTGMAVALRAVDDVLGDAGSAAAARRALDVVRSRFDGERWSDAFELLAGNAGIALGALAAGDSELAVLAVEPYLRTAEQTPNGVHWQHRRGVTSRLHHISHGTLGIVSALAAVGHETGRADLTDVALAGAADVVARNEAGPAGFLVPHSDPQYRPELIERYSFGWCHGPAGDAQTFRLLGQVTGNPGWTELVQSCWHTVTTSGLPQRIRPGFWDNSGRCCGTAGVLALACDRYVEGSTDDLAFAEVLVDDVAARATTDDDGVRWSNYEHRESPSDLPPRTGWAMGNAGIVRELLRFARIGSERDPSYAVAWPDQPAAGGTRAHVAASRLEVQPPSRMPHGDP